jgi:iron complex outermembrane recepter protein
MIKTQLLLTSGLLFALASPAMAQDAAKPEETAAADSGDIIVTATRRSETLSNVPIAISAVSGESLANTGATDVRALNQLAPSLLVSGATSEVNFSARVRGVGTVGENAGLESSVALFIDGVYRSRTGVGLSELGEIERVEVLRGPQGTLFGRNASAGLINIVTKGPSYDFGGSAAATYGNYNYKRLDAGITGPIVAEKAAFRLDGVWQKRDGFIKNVTPGEKDINNRDRYLVRGQVLLELSPGMSLRVIGDYSKRTELCCGAVNNGPNQNVSLLAGNLNFTPNTLLPIIQALGGNIPVATGDRRFVRAQATSPGFNYTSNTKDWGISSEFNWDLGGAKLTSITAYRDYKNRQGQDSDYNALDIIHRTALDRRFRLFTQEVRLQGAALDGRVDWLVGGYYSTEQLNTVDDFKYGSDYERYANCVIANTIAPTLVNVASPTCSNLPVTAFPGYQGLAALTGTSRLSGTGVVANRFQQNSRNYAFFTHNKFDIVEDKLSLTLGARYTNERKALRGSFNTNNNLCAALRNIASSLSALPCVINNTAGPGISLTDPSRISKESEWTGTGVLSYKISDRVLAYASYSKGYKAGGYNLDTSALDAPCNPLAGTAAQRAGCAAQLALPANTPGNARPEAADLLFAPEKVTAFEVGMKYDGRQFNLNAALFYSRFNNFQLNTFNGVNFEVTNVNGCRDSLGGLDRDILPSAAVASTTGVCAAGRLGPGLVTKGIELEASIFPAKNLAINAGMTYASTKYQNNLVGIGGRAFASTNFQLPQRQISNAPNYVVTGGFGYTPEIGGSGITGLFYMDFRYQSDVNTGSDLDFEKIQDGFASVNGRIGLYGKEKRWGIEFWGQNLLNTQYQQIAADTPLQGGGATRAVQAGGPASNQLFIAFPGEPRTYGVTVKTKF